MANNVERVRTDDRVPTIQTVERIVERPDVQLKLNTIECPQLQIVENC